MPTVLDPIKNQSLIYLKNNSSTKGFHIETIGQFLTYLKDSILSLFNSDHKYALLGNKLVAEFNLEHIEMDLKTFLNNENLNTPDNKDQEGAISYSFQYLQTQANIQPNFYDIYYSGNIEPNEMITQLINYSNKLQQQEKLTQNENKDKQKIKSILQQVMDSLNKTPDKDNPKMNTLIDKLTKVTNKLN